MKTNTRTRKKTRPSSMAINGRQKGLLKQPVMSENKTNPPPSHPSRHAEGSRGIVRTYGDTLQFSHISKGETEELDEQPCYRLFFLLEGKMFLSGERYGVNIVRQKELTLLPPGIWILAGGILDSQYAVLDCGRLSLAANTGYMRNLRSHYTTYRSGTENLSLKEALEKELQEQTVRPDERFPGRPIWEDVFATMRSAYTVEEMASLFYPMLNNSINN